MISVKLSFGKKTRPKAKSELIGWYLQRSKMDVTVEGESTNPERITIQIDGELSNIPPLKNQRHPRFPGLHPNVEARLEALTIQFEDAFPPGEGPTFQPDTEVFAVLLHGEQQGNKVDVDNAAASVKDWLEPASKLIGGKNKRARGWGVGIVENDETVSMLPLKYSQVGPRTSSTLIVLTPLLKAQEELCRLVANVCFV